MITPTASETTIKELSELSERSGVARVHMLAWRDLDDPEAGGSEIHAHNVAALWAQAGIGVSHRTSFAPGHPAHSRRAGYDVNRKAGRYMVFPRSVAAEIAGRNGARDGLVEIWNGMPFMSPVWCRGPRMVWLHHVHGPMWKMSLPERLAQLGVVLEERVAPKFYRHSPIVTLSESSKRELVHELGFAAERVTVVAPGVDPLFSPGGAKRSEPTVLAVGRLVPVKDFPRLVGVMARVHEHVPEARLVIVGEGYERERIEALIEQLDATDYIHLAGRVDDATLLDLYRSAWVLASTSVREGWGMTLTEAAASGTPCVATRIAGHVDAASDGRSGLLAESDADLAAGLVRVLTDAELRARLESGALDRAAELTWEITAIETFRVLADDAVARQGRP